MTATLDPFVHKLADLGVPLFTASPIGDDYARPAGWPALAAAGNAERLAQWQPGDAVMVVCGGLLAVVDIDPRNGGDVAAMRAVLSELGVRVFGEIATPGGGVHFYVAGSPDLPTTHAWRDLVGVDVQSYGANVYLPGTLRAKYGGRGYVVVHEDLAALADGGDPDGAEALAGWVAEHRAAGKADTFTPSEPWNGTAPTSREAAYLAAALRNQVAEVAGTGSGRNNAVYLAAMKLGSYVAGAGLDEAEVVEQLMAAMVTNGAVGDDSERQARATILSGLRNGKAHPRKVPGEFDGLFGPTTAKSTGCSWHEHPVEQVLPGGPPALVADPHEATRARFPALDWSALWLDETEEEWIIEPLLPARRIVALYSAPKVGKSLLLLEIAAAVASGRKVLGVAPTPRRVLYVDLENDPRDDVRQRLQAMGYGPEDLANLAYLSYPTMAALDSPQGGADLLAAVAAYSAEVVIIDTVSRVVAGEENTNDTWLNFYRNTGLPLKKLGVAMMRLDHSGKDETKGMRGGSAKYGDVDAVWRLSEVVAGSMYRLDCTDHRMRVTEPMLALRRETEPQLRHVVDAYGRAATFDAKVAEVVRLADDEGLPADANREALREVAGAAGIRAGNELLAKVVKVRKAVSGMGEIAVRKVADR